MPAPAARPSELAHGQAFTLADKLALARAFRALCGQCPQDSTENRWALGSRGNSQTQGAIDRFWRLVIASALNADIDDIAVPYAAKVIRELFMNSAEAGSMGMSTVPLSELYASACRRSCSERGGERASQYAMSNRRSGMKRPHSGHS